MSVHRLAGHLDVALKVAVLHDGGFVDVQAESRGNYIIVVFVTAAVGLYVAAHVAVLDVSRVRHPAICTAAHKASYGGDVARLVGLALVIEQREVLYGAL